MSFEPFSYEQHKQFLLDTLRTKLPTADLSQGSFWQIWVQGQARGLAGLTSALTHLENEILPDRATGVILDHHAMMYDVDRLQPLPAVGKVKVTITDPNGLNDSGVDLDALTLRDIDEREYELVDSDDLEQTLPGLYEIEVIAKELGADSNQVPGVTLTFYLGDEPLSVANAAAAASLDDSCWVIAPGIINGRDLEVDSKLSNRIVRTLATGEGFTDTVENYRKWVVEASADWVARQARIMDYVADEVHEVFIHRDRYAKNRIYAIPLAAPPDRIAEAGFLQTAFNLVDSMAPVTVDPIVPRIKEERIDITVAVEPKMQARWDWSGVKLVGDTSSGETTDREIWLHRGCGPSVSDSECAAGTYYKFTGADGLEAGMRIVINGEQRVIGHVDRRVDIGPDELDRIFLTEDLSVVPDMNTPVFPGGPIVDQAHEAIALLFDTLGPLHKVQFQAANEQNVLASVITDALMEIPDVYDAHVFAPEEVADVLLADEAYLAGLLAYLAVPGRLSVVPMTIKEMGLIEATDGIPEFSTL